MDLEDRAGNVCIYAMRRDAENHVPLSQWLSARLTGEEPVGISELVLSSLVRITTNSRIFGQPSTPEQAMTSASH
ncbi:MAG: hypothetical protein M3492_12380, partial [Actinomycetota bacterium]|nr:hypothetical protein [Actinomycetota bacterium]